MIQRFFCYQPLSLSRFYKMLFRISFEQNLLSIYIILQVIETFQPSQISQDHSNFTMYVKKKGFTTCICACICVQYLYQVPGSRDCKEGKGEIPYKYTYVDLFFVERKKLVQVLVLVPCTVLLPAHSYTNLVRTSTKHVYGVYFILIHKSTFKSTLQVQDKKLQNKFLKGEHISCHPFFCDQHTTLRYLISHISPCLLRDTNLYLC